MSEKRTNRFYQETDGIFRLRVPFDTVYTSVFLLQAEIGVILVDCATTDGDVNDVILPALGELGYEPSDIRALILTHSHGDHAGGRARLLALSPRIEVITSVREICNGISTYPLPGHTEDSIGVFDERTRTLISGDGLQGAGVDKYRCCLETPKAYMETLKRVESDERIENILFSHAYEPWNTDIAVGRERVLDCIAQCKKYVK